MIKENKKQKIESEQKKEVQEAEKEIEELRGKELKKANEIDKRKQRIKDALERWVPKTELGKKVKSGQIKDLDEILDKNLKIFEPEVVDYLIKPETELIFVGQAKGKFGGGKRRAWRQTQRKTKEGNIPTFSTMVAVGNKNGYVGIGNGKAKETLPAREKAIRRAKLNIIKVNRGCGSFDCSCNEVHSIPFKVQGKAGSSKITLMPAPQGTGLVISDEGKKIMKLAGIKDIYSKTSGHIRTSFNLAKAIINALEKLNKFEG